MEHAVPFDDVRPWRTAAIVASGIATLELLVLIVGAALLLAHPFAREAAKPAVKRPTGTTRAHRKPTRAAVLPRARTRVIVLNGNGETGAAATEAAAIRARGYRISAVGNAPTPAHGPTLVMYRPGFALEARRLARDAGINIVTALDGLKPGALHRAQLVIVLGY